MLTSKRAQKDRYIIVSLSGVVDDAADLDDTIGPVPSPPSELHIDCGKVTRINSVGVKAWIKYFQRVESAKVKLKFWNCSTSLVHQMNMVSNFTCGGSIESLQVPFCCESCNHAFTESMSAKELKTLKFEVPQRQCPQCKQVAIFDDLPKVYFRYLMKAD